MYDKLFILLLLFDFRFVFLFIGLFLIKLSIIFNFSEFIFVLGGDIDGLKDIDIISLKFFLYLLLFIEFEFFSFFHNLNYYNFC